MQNPKNQNEVFKRKQKIVQELQPNKICKCGACEPRKPKLPDGLRRLKIQPKYLEYKWKRAIVPQILLQGEWLRNTGFECEQHVIITVENQMLIIKLEKE